MALEKSLATGMSGYGCNVNFHVHPFTGGKLFGLLEKGCVFLEDAAR